MIELLLSAVAFVVMSVIAFLAGVKVSQETIGRAAEKMLEDIKAIDEDDKLDLSDLIKYAKSLRWTGLWSVIRGKV